MSQKGKVVYTIKDIPEGQAIPTEALEERDIEQSKIPQDAITSASLAAGRVAKFGMTSGQIVSQHDLAALASRWLLGKTQRRDARDYVRYR